MLKVTLVKKKKKLYIYGEREQDNYIELKILVLTMLKYLKLAVSYIPVALIQLPSPCKPDSVRFH